MSKSSRLFAIKEIINTLPIANQDELRVQLKKKGFKVTQATLSRDMKELGVARVASGDRARYVLGQESETHLLRPIVSAEVVSIHSNESMVVIKTLPGCANVVGEFLDSLKHSDIIGTLAGDNTLLVIPASQQKTSHVIQFLKKQLFEGKESI